MAIISSDRPVVIRWLKSKQGAGQPIRDDGPASHLLTKRGTPTMGGCCILIVDPVSTLLWADLANGYVWTVLLVTAGFGLIGFCRRLPQAHQAHLTRD